MTLAIKAAVAAGTLLSHPGAVATGPGSPSRALGVAALITWLVDAVSGGYMLGTWIVRGGLQRQRTTGDGLAPAVVFGHFGLATTGLLVWASYVVARWAFLGWLAIGLLMLVVGLGISTVTLWTPFPARRAAADAHPSTGGPAGSTLAGPADGTLSPRVTDEDLARALTDEALLAKLVDDVLARAPNDPARGGRRPGGLVVALIPAGHGVAAMATVLLTVLTAVSAR